MSEGEVLLITDRWDEQGGGRERYLAELGRRLSARAPVRVFCGSCAPNTGAAGALRLHVIGGPAAFAESRLRGAVARYRDAHPDAPVLAARPCIGATHYQFHGGLLQEAFAAEREAFESPLRRSLHGPAQALNVRRRSLLATERRMLSASPRPRLMAFSSTVLPGLRRTFAVPDSEVRVVAQGVNLRVFTDSHDRFVATGVGPGLRLLFVACNPTLKGFHPLIAALARARQQGIRFHLTVAGASATNGVMRPVVRAGIEQAVQVVGKATPEAIASLCRQSDALVHPAFYDPFGRVIVEALASGCPVVTTRRCGAAEHITPGVHGYLLDDPRDEAGLVAALAALGEEAGRTGMRANAAGLGRRFDEDGHYKEVERWLTSS